MPVVARLKPGSLKDPELAQLFSQRDPESRYCDLREVGSGSFGNVYYAQDRESNQTVAIKKMHFTGNDAQEKWNDIVKEVKFLRSINHPHIVEYRACFLKDRTCWLVMEYCIGSAADIINVFKDQLVEDAIAEICAQTLEALTFIHERLFIHRDVKAGNILITDAGVVKLGDLGSASMQSPANSFVGSPYWIAPEVILAMDDGEYGTKADIWSLGITTIELANRRPPLHDLNTMSALYHIAQNAPPVLQRTHPVWPDVHRSDDIIAFVAECLQKDANHRPTARKASEHIFLRRPRRTNIMQTLVKHTKKRVLKLDSDVYTRMKKVFYLDGPPAQRTLSSSSEESDYECFVANNAHQMGKSPRSASNGNSNPPLVNGTPKGDAPKLPSAPSNGHTIGSLSSENGSTLVGDDRRDESAENAAETPRKSAPKIGENGDAGNLPTPTAADPNRTVINVGGGEEEEEEDGYEEIPDNPSQSTLPDDDLSTSSPIATTRIPNFEEEINTLRRSKFSTLRPIKLITREIEDSKRENNAREQMSGYQRLRQHHHRELQQLEERCRFEADSLRQRHEKEYEQQLSAAQREIHKFRGANHSQLEKRARDNDDLLRKLRKQRAAANETDLKTFVLCQKREYKYNKEQLKKHLKDRGLRKQQFEEALKGGKAELMQRWAQAENQYVADQKEQLLADLSEQRRRAQQELQSHEQRLLAMEHSTRTRQLETLEYLLMSHHNAAREQSVSHFNECAQMKKRHLQVQHESELNNQTDYTKRALDDMKKAHAVKQKNLPRELKLKETQIRKQFRQTVKIQARQYKVLQQQMLHGIQLKEEQREVAARLKAEQNRKITSLAVQYDNTIKRMMSEQTVQLDSAQEGELRSLNEKLQREMNSLLDFQQQQKANLESSCARELENMNNGWAKKKSALQQKIEDDRMRFEAERSAQMRELSTAQERDRDRLESLDRAEREQLLNAMPSVRSKASLSSSNGPPQLPGSAISTPASTKRRQSRSPTSSSRSTPSHQSTNL